MERMTFEGITDQGHIRLLADVELPDQTRLYVTVATTVLHQQVHLRSPRLVHAKQVADFQLDVSEDEADANV